MAVDKKTFLKKVTILCDTNEKENKHIKKVFDELGVRYEDKSLDFGDYSFIIDDRNFSLNCVIERKANVNELYGNLTQERGRIEREFEFASAISNEFTLLIETVGNIDELRAYEVPDWEMKQFGRIKKDIGELCYFSLQSWQSGNKYKFNTVFVKNKNETASKILERFYYYWRNYKLLSANRKLKRR